MTARLAQRAKDASTGTLLVSAFCALLLLLIPVMFSMLRQHPYEICARFFEYDIGAESFEITGDAVVFRHGNTVLAAQREFFPEEDIANGDYLEIFDRLALLNSYYRDMLLPVLLLLSAMCLMVLVSVGGICVGLMGLGRKMTHALTFGQRLRAFAACMWVAAIPAVLVGFIMPIFHLLIFQLLITWLAWKTQKLL